MNRLFHINTFSQISPTLSSPIESGDTVVANPAEGNNSRINQIRTATATVLLSLAISAGAQDRPSTPVNNPQSTLIAQASTETDGKIYTAEVIQVDGTKKTVKYFRDKEGAIIPPTVVDGKLVDGSIAPDHPLRAKNAQVKILVKYDKGALLVLAMVGSKDLISEAFKDISTVRVLAEQGKSISKEQIQKSIFGQYIILLSGGKIDEIMKTTEFIATTQLKMSTGEINQMKRELELKAITIWKSTTGSMVVS